MRRVEAINAQPVTKCKGLGRDGLTMTFLEEGGYFDLPIKVALLNIFDMEAAADAAIPCQHLYNTLHVPKMREPTSFCTECIQALFA